MPTPQEIEARFWKKLDADRTVMLTLDGGRAEARPMTALRDDPAEGDRGPVWFFTSKQTTLAEALAGAAQPASFAFASKDHELFACVRGRLAPSDDRAIVDRLWNPFIAAWYPGGKDDPTLALLRFDPEDAEVWLDETSLVTGLKLLLGADPKKDYADKVAKVDLR